MGNAITLNLPKSQYRVLDRAVDEIEPRMDPMRYLYYGWPMQFVSFDLRLSREEMLATGVAWACIRQIVDPLSSVRGMVFTRDQGGRRKEVVNDNVEWMWNVSPNPDMPAQAAKELMFTSMLVNGDGFGYINFNNASKPAQIWPLDFDYMRVLRNRETGSLVYRYFHPDSGAPQDLDPSEVLHFRGPSIYGLTGDSTIYRASKAIALAVAQERYATSYYANGATPGIIMKPPANANRKPDAAADDRIRQEWKKYHGAAKGKANGMAVGEPGWDYQIIENDPSKSQVVPSRQFSIEEVARYFGVPLVLLGVQAAAHGYGTNVSQLYQFFARNTLMPWSNRITQPVQVKLFPERAPWREFELDMAPLMRGDEKERQEADEIAIRSGKMTINEARAQDRMNSIGPEGDKTLVASTLKPLEQVLEPPKPPPAPVAPKAPGKEPPDGEDMPGVGDAARAAVALDRYARKMKARRDDLEKHAPEKVEENLAAERAKSLAGLEAECGAVLGDDVAKAAEAVEAGEPAHLAVARLAKG